ncbi:hypothetical protein PRIPAC_74053 [Pristionchus pacificus]|uniref:Uncharacterized protein n=1 Tax=Pristionchus pacificus TaxID=54126 RepID=A0A454Y2K6_PRIPA|nr:hypothetical protein PRIPAC_74053 [Pristionchus pacificus]|eukprot:PDM71979.1 hypothetical protein PRIPAC_38386 [Pristionchus pacificus]
MSSAKLILVCALLVLCAFVADVDAQYYWPSYYGGYGGYGYGGYGYGSYYGYPYSYYGYGKREAGFGPSQGSGQQQ